jgi:hypothetical protein
MPRPISWLPRLHEIRRSVANSVRSHYDRRDLQALFELQPRAAGKLLGLLPTVAIGTSLLVERESLGVFLDGIREAEDTTAYVEEQRSRKQAVSRRKPRSLIRRDAEPRSLASLPQSITLSRGRLEVSFATLEELAQAMYALAQAMETDGDVMALLYEVEPIPEPLVEDDGVYAMFRELEAMEAQHRQR